MPVPLSTVEKASRPLEEKIEDYITTSVQPDMAYSVIEVLAGAMERDPLALEIGAILFPDGEEFRRTVDLARQVLTRLESEGRVKSYQYAGEKHYALAK